jgi:hypothetical protein
VVFASQLNNEVGLGDFTFHLGVCSVSARLDFLSEFSSIRTGGLSY